jgi:superoxide dismutase, Fe-Mn family
MDIRQVIDLVEDKKPALERVKLDYSHEDLRPVFSGPSIDFHYDKLYKGYVDRFNNREGDPGFNEAGAFLHRIWFSQFRRPSNRQPRGPILDLINKHFKSLDKFKAAIKAEAMKLHGSGWIYLSRSGRINRIVNHQKRQDIVILIDMWEHAFQRDYGSNKGKYIDNLWRIIDWEAVSQRI